MNPSNQTNGGTSSVEGLSSSLFQASSPDDVRSPALLQVDVESKTNDPQPDEDKLSPLPQRNQRSSTTPPEYMKQLSSNILSPPHQQLETTDFFSID